MNLTPTKKTKYNMKKKRCILLFQYLEQKGCKVYFSYRYMEKSFCSEYYNFYYFFYSFNFINILKEYCINKHLHGWKLSYKSHKEEEDDDDDEIWNGYDYWDMYW